MTQRRNASVQHHCCQVIEDPSSHLPQLGKRSLYPTLSTKSEKGSTRNYTNFLQYADGKNDLFDISNILKVEYNKTLKIYNILKKHKLIS